MIDVLIIVGNDIMSLNCVGHKMAVVLVSDMRVVVMIKDRRELSEGKTPRKGKKEYHTTRLLMMIPERRKYTIIII